MNKTRFIHWQQDKVWLGYLEEFPDYWTQGFTYKELRQNLADIYREMKYVFSGPITLEAARTKH